MVGQGMTLCVALMVGQGMTLCVALMVGQGMTLCVALMVGQGMILPSLYAHTSLPRNLALLQLIVQIDFHTLLSTVLLFGALRLLSVDWVSVYLLAQQVAC